MNFKFSKNQLKIIAAVSMTIDHVGLALFPHIQMFRIIGRLAFPIFAFSVYEGCKYTKNRRKYLLLVFGLGVLSVFGYYVFAGYIFGNVLITFSFSICIIYCLDNFFDGMRSGRVLRFALSSFALGVCITLAVFLSRTFGLDYGVAGVALPVFPYVAEKILPSTVKQRPETEKTLAFLGFSLALLWLCYVIGGIQFYSLFSLLLLAFLGDERGKYNMKYFFYVFYPLHLIIIGIIAKII